MNIFDNTEIEHAFESFKDTAIYERYLLNAAQFSSAKNASETSLLQEAIFNDDGELKGYSEYYKDAQQITDIVNDTWMRTEYDTAQMNAIAGEQWRNMEADKDLYPYWVYKGVMDDREREEHVALEDMVFKIGDPEGDAIYPPADWNCRCSADQIDEQGIEDQGLKIASPEEVTKHLNEDVAPNFRYNSGIQGTLPNDHSYFQVLENANAAKPEMFQGGEEIAEAIRVKGISAAQEVMQDFETSAAEKEALKEYTGGKYGIINSHERRGKNISDEIQDTITQLDRFIAAAPKVEAESYRGLTLDESIYNEYKNLKKGEIYTDKGFMSTSYDKSVASDFGGSAQWQVEMSIKGKNGVLIEGLSDAKKEKEILFGRGSNFKIESIKIKEKTGIYGKISLSLVEQ